MTRPEPPPEPGPPLKIERVRVVEIDLPLRVPFQISGGTMRSRRSLLAELHSGGAVGYGESAPFEFPFYSSETIGSVCALWEQCLIPRIEGKSFAGAAEFNAALQAGVRGNPFARCGLENAFWDLLAATRGKSYPELIAEALAGMGVEPALRAPADRVPSGVAIGIPEGEDLGRLREWIEEYRAEGYRRVKIKIRPGWDAAPCELARATLGAGFPLWPDANASFDLAAHEPTLRRLDEFQMEFLEQPLDHDDLLDHARLSRILRTPICLDESLKGERAARQALECGASRVWNVKVQRMGGLLESMKVYALAAREGVRLWGGTMPESGVGAQAILALAAFPLFDYAADIEPSSRWYLPGVDPLEIAMDREGWIAVPRTRGVAPLLEMDRYKKAGKVLRG